MDLEFRGAIIYWRGPSPFHFVTVPDAERDEIEDVAARVTYGWGMVPVTARIGKTTWTTSLWPKDGTYVVPVKAAVQRAEGLELGDVVAVSLTIG